MMEQHTRPQAAVEEARARVVRMLDFMIAGVGRCSWRVIQGWIWLNWCLFWRVMAGTRIQSLLKVGKEDQDCL